MPKKIVTSKKLKPKIVVKPALPRTNEELEAFIAEANEVKAITQQSGWQILVRDLTNLKDGLASRLAYISPKRPEHEEARIQYIAIDKIFAIVDDYENNRNEAIKLLNKLENPDVAVTMDVDNE